MGSRMQYKANGDRYYREGSFSSALYWYNAGVERYPQNVGLLVSKGNVLYRLYRTDDAYQAYYQAVVKKKKLRVFHLFIKKHPYPYSKDYEKFIDTLQRKHGLLIEPKAVPFFIAYVKKQQEGKKKRAMDLRWFRDQFNAKSLSTVDDYIDEYLRRYWIDDRVHFELMVALCQTKRFGLSPQKVRDKMVERDHFWQDIGMRRWDIEGIDGMTGRQFEFFMADYFKRCGYSAWVTPHSHDAGADIVVSGLGKTCVVQCKRRRQKVGVAAVQEVFSAMHVHKASTALVISTNFFTPEAEKLAHHLGVELWNRWHVFSKLFRYQSPW